MWPSRFSLTVLLLVLCLSSGTTGDTPLSPCFVFYSQQGRKLLPRVSANFVSYLPLIDLLQWLDLPYSESASAGFVQIHVGNHFLRLNRDKAVVMADDAPLSLPSPVAYLDNRWLVPPEFLIRALSRVLPEKISSSTSGNRFSVGTMRFNRINARGVSTDQASRIIINMSAPSQVEIRKEQNRMVFSFGTVAVDPFKDDFQYRDSLINSITFEDTLAAGQLVVNLADRALQTRVTHIADQNVYLLEVSRPVESRAAESLPEPLPNVTGPIPATRGKRWHHLTIDPGHGGSDRGAQVREGLHEKEVVLTLARKLRWGLQTRLGLTVVLTRSEDQAVSMDDRALAANAAQSDLFLSLHVGNWSHPRESKSYAYVTRMLKADQSVEGGQEVEVLEPAKINFLPWDRAQRLSLNRSAQLAGLIQAELNRSLNEGGTGLNYRRAPLKLLSRLAMPAVLVEIGNASEPGFRESINDPQFQSRVISSLTAAIERFRSETEHP